MSSLSCTRSLLNVSITEFSFIHLGETFTLAVSPEIYNTRFCAINDEHNIFKKVFATLNISLKYNLQLVR